jgi:hypothetical protein
VAMVGEGDETESKQKEVKNEERRLRTCLAF